MRSTVGKELIFEPEIEKLAKRNRKEAKRRKAQQRDRARRENSQAEIIVQELIMEEQNGNRRITLGDYATPTSDGCSSSIVRPPIPANNFEIKPALLHLVQQDQFGGSDLEDPNLHIASFLQLCDTIKMNGVPEDAIRLRLFPFSLRDRAKCWLQAQPRGSITTWEDLVSKFLTKYFPPSKYNKMRGEITCFTQREGESLYEAWERFKELLRKCPHHGFTDIQQIHIFYSGIKPQTRLIIDASAGGSLNTKTADEAQELIETMASNEYQMPSDRSTARRGVMELETQDAILAQNKLISQQLETLTKRLQAVQLGAVHSQPLKCDFCGGEHENGQCEASFMGVNAQEHVNYMGQGQRSNYPPFSNSYNPNYRNHPNFSWRNGPHLQNQSPQQQPQSQSAPSQDKSSNLENVLSQFIQATQASFKNTEASIKNLENQVGQLSKQLNERTNDNFPGDTVANPK